MREQSQNREATQKNLNDALDKIRDKHAVGSIFLASEQEGMSAAPMKISFNHIPDVDAI